MKDDFFLILGALGVLVGLILILPFISFWLSYFGGWLCKIAIGNTLTKALNILFNTTHITAEMLPWMAGALGWIGGFFKAINFNSSLKK